jgi:hypothetical protein
MFQVILQATIRNLRSKMKLPRPGLSKDEKDHQSKDKTGLILILFLVGSILMFAMFNNLTN